MSKTPLVTQWSVAEDLGAEAPVVGARFVSDGQGGLLLSETGPEVAVLVAAGDGLAIGTGQRAGYILSFDGEMFVEGA